MNWIYFAFGSAILSAITALLQKKTLNVEHATEFSATFAVLNLVISLPFFFFIDYSRITWQALSIVFVGSIISSAALLYSAKSLRHMEVGENTSLFAMSPAFTVILGTLFLGEKIGPLQIAGVFFMVLGGYIAELSSKDFWGPFKVIKQSKYVHYLFLSMVLFSISSIIDRVALHNYDMQTTAYLGFIHLFIALFSFFLLSYEFDGFSGVSNAIKKYGWILFVIAALTVAQRYFQIVSTKLAYVGLVITVKRSSALFTVIIGGALFKESGVRRRVFACLIIIAGLALVLV